MHEHVNEYPTKSGLLWRAKMTAATESFSPRYKGTARLEKIGGSGIVGVALTPEVVMQDVEPTVRPEGAGRSLGEIAARIVRLRPSKFFLETLPAKLPSDLYRPYDLVESSAETLPKPEKTESRIAAIKRMARMAWNRFTELPPPPAPPSWPHVNIEGSKKISYVPIGSDGSGRSYWPVRDDEASLPYDEELAA